MATFLDVSGLAQFRVVFVFLFVWIIVYAILLWSRILGDNKFVSAIVGLVMGLLVLSSNASTRAISAIVPLIVVIFVFILLINIASRMLGANIESFPALKGLFIVFLVFIIIIALGISIRDNIETDSGDLDVPNSVAVILHPKVLGMILILVISVFTIALLASRST